MAYTLEELVQMGARPVQTIKTPGSTYTYDELKGMGATSNFNQAKGSLSFSQSKVDMFRQEAERAKQSVDALQTKTGLAAQTGRETVNNILGGPVKALRTIGQGVGEALGAENPVEKYTDFAGNPAQTAQADVAEGASVPGAFGETALNAASVVPIGKAGGLLKKAGGELLESSAVKPIVDAVKKPVGRISAFLESRVAKAADKKATETTVKALTPKLTPTEIREAARARQGTTSFFGGSKIDPTKDKHFMEVVNNSKGIVKGKTVIEDIDNVSEALGKEAESIKSQIKSVDHPYSFKELNARIKDVNQPAMLKSGNLDKVFERVQQKAMEISKSKQGKISDLFDARKEFDQYVKEEFPDLYTNDTLTPMKTAIKNVRNAMNDFIEENLPKEVGFKDSMKKQRLFYDALDNLETQVTGEIKKGGIVKKIVSNPIARYGAAAAGGSVVVNALGGKE